MRAQICLRGKMSERFIIPLNGLTAGENVFSWQIGREFFESFENAEILDAQLDVEVRVEKSGRYIGVDCEISGTVTVECDRCLDELDIPVDADVRLSVKYGEESPSEEFQNTDREILFVPEDCAELDMSQIIYDYVCISLPMQRTHDEGECNPSVMKYYGSRNEDGTEAENVVRDNPFSALKSLL